MLDKVTFTSLFTVLNDHNLVFEHIKSTVIDFRTPQRLQYHSHSTA